MRRATSYHRGTNDRHSAPFSTTCHLTWFWLSPGSEALLFCIINVTTTPFDQGLAHGNFFSTHRPANKLQYVFNMRPDLNPRSVEHSKEPFHTSRIKNISPH